MKKFICDTCHSEITRAEYPKFYSAEVPTNWIDIKIEGYYNSNDITGDRRVTQTSGEYHFCSKECFVNSFFFTQEEIEDNNI